MLARSTRTAFIVIAEPLELRRLLSVTYGTNVVQNGGAEQFSGTADGSTVITPNDWTANGSGGPTVSPYTSGYGKEIAIPQPSGGGNDFFSGGATTNEGDFFQTIDLSSIASDIDAGHVNFTLSAYLGGNGSQADNASVFVNFSGASMSLLSQSEVGPVTPADRGDTTEFLFRSTNGTVPVGARSVQVQIHFEYDSGVYNDSFADEISLVLNNPTLATGSISGEVFNDANNNGTLDGGESGISGITVYNDANNDNKLDDGEASTVTNASGDYSFTGLAAGSYKVRAIGPTGATQTTPANGLGHTVTLSAGQSVSGENFGFHTAASGGTVSGTVTGAPGGETIYLDANNNSVLDAGELSTTTNASGQYSFSNVPAGAFIIRQIRPDGYIQTSPADNYGIHITVTNGGSLTNENFTDKSTATGGSVSGTVTNGKPGETIYLDANNDSTLDNDELSTTLTASDTFSFTNVPAGAYIIRQILPTGYTQTSPSSGFGIHITVTSGGNLTNENFTDKAPAGNIASIAGTVFDDNNGDGMMDDGESGLSGWAVYIDLNNSGSFVSGDPTTITGANGSYDFTDLAPGTYIIRVEPQNSFHQTSPANNLGHHVTITAGQAATGVLFGEQQLV